MLKKEKSYSPIIVFIILSFTIIVISAILSLLNVQAEYITVSKVTNGLVNNVVEVKNLLGTLGIKNIVSSTVNNFVNFEPLANIIIVLIGIGVLESTGFFKVAFELMTKNAKKNAVTFTLILFSLIFSICGDIGFVIMMPIGALLFKHGRRNPLGGIISTFAALSFGKGINIFLNSTDISLLKLTQSAARIMDIKYEIGIFFSLFIMILLMIAVSIAFTMITEKKIMPRLPKVESFEEETKITNKELRGLIVGLGLGFLFILFILYTIIPGLPLSGGLLDADETYYINKLFGSDSLFNKSFIFIVTMLFIIIGLGYGIMTKNIKHSKDLVNAMGYSLDKIGSVILLIFCASIFYNIFEQSNIGLVIVASISNLISNINLTGIWLIIVVVLLIAFSNLFCPSQITKWTMLSGSVVPLLMNASISPEYGQLIYTISCSISNGITPLFMYYILYIALLDKYNKNDEMITMRQSFRYMIPYFTTITIICLVVLIGWYMLGVPIGIGSLPGVTYGA